MVLTLLESCQSVNRNLLQLLTAIFALSRLILRGSRPTISVLSSSSVSTVAAASGWASQYCTTYLERRSIHHTDEKQTVKHTSRFIYFIRIHPHPNPNNFNPSFYTEAGVQHFYIQIDVFYIPNKFTQCRLIPPSPRKPLYFSQCVRVELSGVCGNFPALAHVCRSPLKNYPLIH